MRSEANLQQTLVSTLRGCFPEFVLVLSLSGTQLRGTAAQKAQVIAEWERQGWVRGIFDLQILMPGGKLLNLELKKPSGGKQSPDQVDMQNNLEAIGHNYHLIRDIPHVMSLIAEQTTLTYRQSMYDQFGSKLPIPVKPYYHL
jgi:hypothetical protein